MWWSSKTCGTPKTTLVHLIRNSSPVSCVPITIRWSIRKLIMTNYNPWFPLLNIVLTQPKAKPTEERRKEDAAKWQRCAFIGAPISKQMLPNASDGQLTGYNRWPNSPVSVLRLLVSVNNDTEKWRYKSTIQAPVCAVQTLSPYRPVWPESRDERSCYGCSS